MKVSQLIWIGVLGYAILVALAWLFQRRLIYLPMGQQVPPARDVLPNAQEVTLYTPDDLQLAAWWVPSGREDGAAVIIFNGNAGNRSHRADLARAFRGLNLSVLLVDYRGFGGNPGKPSEKGLIEDARAARNFVDEKRRGKEGLVVYFGESLGAAVAIALAGELPPDALILRSPFSSLVEMGCFHYPFLPVRQFLRDRYPSLARIRKLACPVLVLAGGEDEIVPVSQSRDLFEASAAEVKQFVLLAGADHNDSEFYGGVRMMRHISGFLDGLQ